MLFSKTVLVISNNYSVGIKGVVLFSNASLHAAMPSSFRTDGYSLQTLKQKREGILKYRFIYLILFIYNICCVTYVAPGAKNILLHCSSNSATLARFSVGVLMSLTIVLKRAPLLCNFGLPFNDPALGLTKVKYCFISLVITPSPCILFTSFSISSLLVQFDLLLSPCKKYFLPSLFSFSPYILTYPSQRHLILCQQGV